MVWHYQVKLGNAAPKVHSLVNLAFSCWPLHSGEASSSRETGQRDASHLLSTLKYCHSFQDFVLQLFSNKVDANRSVGYSGCIVDQYNEAALWLVQYGCTVTCQIRCCVQKSLQPCNALRTIKRCRHVGLQLSGSVIMNP